MEILLSNILILSIVFVTFPYFSILRKRHFQLISIGYFCDTIYVKLLEMSWKVMVRKIPFRDLSLENEEGRGCSSLIDNDKSRSIIEDDSSKTAREIA